MSRSTLKSWIGHWTAIDYSPNEKAILEISALLFICKATTTEVNFCLYKQCSQVSTRLICEWAIFAQNASIVF